VAQPVPTPAAPVLDTTSVRYPQPWSRVIAAGMFGAVVAVLLVSLAYWVMRLAGVPMEAARATGGSPDLVGWPAVVVVVLAAGGAASLVAGLVRRSPRSPRIVVLVGTVAYLVSLAAPVLQPADVTTATRLSLIVLHTIAYVVVVWFAARGVTPEDPPVEAKARFGIE
jgi:hypothetical protein